MEKDITDYFRRNIFEALSMYTEWKMLAYSRSSGVVSKEFADRYVEVQNYHPNFFVITERACLISFVLLILHSFDKRDDSFSLYKVDEKATEEFVEKNSDIIQKLKFVRNKVFAHKESADTSEFKIPAITELDSFFEELIGFYNKLTKKVDDSSTDFSNAKDTLKRDIELMFINLYRGEKIRKSEIDIEWMWGKSDKKASDIL